MYNCKIYNNYWTYARMSSKTTYTIPLMLLRSSWFCCCIVHTVHVYHIFKLKIYKTEYKGKYRIGILTISKKPKHETIAN